MALMKSLEVKIGADTRGFDKGVRQVQSGVKAMGSGLQTLGRAAATLGGISVGIAGVVSALKDYTVIRNAVQRTNDIFKEHSKTIKGFASTALESFGMSESVTYEYAAIYGNLFSGMTRDAEENTKVTTAMMRATAVISSKTGRTMEDTAARIRSGILGNTEAIEDLGINVPVAAIKASNAFKQLANGKAWETLEYEQQQQIRALAILEQTTAKYGDTVSMVEGYSLNRMSSAFRDLKTYAGMFLTTALQPLINAMATLAISATTALKAVAGLFGINLEGKLAAPAEQGTESQEQFGDATKDATEELKKQLNTLAGFDKLEVLDAGISAGTSQSTPGGGSSPFDKLGMPNYEIKPIEFDTTGIQSAVDTVKRMLEPLNKISFAPLETAFGNLKDSIEPITQKLFDGLKWSWDNLLVPLATWTIEDVAPAFLEALGAAAGVLDSALEALQPLGNWLWENFLKPIAEWTGGTIVSILEGIATGLNAISDWIQNHQETVRKIAEVVLAFAAAWLGVNTALNIYNGLKSAVVATTAAIGAGVSTTTLAMTKVGLVLIWVASQWENLTYWAETNMQRLTNAAKSTADYFENNWRKSMLGSLDQTLVGLVDLVEGAFTLDWGKAWSGIENLTRGVTNVIIDVLNVLVDAINLFGANIPKIARINDNNFYSEGISRSRGTAAEDSRGGSYREEPKNTNYSSFKSSQLEKLSAGTIVSKPTRGVFGENGTEILMPLENHDGWIRKLANDINRMGGNNGGGEQVINVYIGNDKLDTYIYKSQSKKSFITNGKAALV